MPIDRKKLNAYFNSERQVNIKEMLMSDTQTEMPKYECHKLVWALKIKSVEVIDSDSNSLLSFEEGQFSDIRVDGDYMNKHNPQEGGYYVVYKGGYKSFSPADVFEDEYTKV